MTPKLRVLVMSFMKEEEREGSFLAMNDENLVSTLAAMSVKEGGTPLHRVTELHRMLLSERTRALRRMSPKLRGETLHAMSPWDRAAALAAMGFEEKMPMLKSMTPTLTLTLTLFRGEDGHA